MTEYIEKIVTVGELKSLYTSNEYNIEIDTPDGWQFVSNWFDKGPMELVSIQTENGHSTNCATNHMIECNIDDTNLWLPAAEIVKDVTVLTKDGFSQVSNVNSVGIEECYDFTVDHPNHRYWGDGFSSHNSGKSYICSGNVIKNAQEQGIYVILIDTENALDEAWLKALGVDTSEDKMLRLSMSMIDDVAKTISDFMKEYKSQEDRPKVLFVVDSLGMLLTPTDTDQFNSGNVSKGDMGRKPKALGALIRNCVNMFGNYNVGLLASNHVYGSQNIYDPDDIISGGQSQVFSASIVVAMQKFKLKEDEEGVKTSDVRGIRAKCKVMKTRYSKPFEDIEVRIPWDTGADPYSGLYDLFVKKGIIVKDGMRYAYTDLAGTVHKYYQKEWAVNENNILDLIMSEFNTRMAEIEANTPDDFIAETVSEDN